MQGGAHVTLVERNAFLGGNSTKATSGINGTPSRTQAAMGVEDGYEHFLEDMVRSATGVKTGPCPPSYPLAEMFAGGSGASIDWLQDGFGLALDTVSRMGGHSKIRTHRTKTGGKFPGMEITSALMKKYEQMADKDDGVCDLLINSILKELVKEHGRVVGIKFENADGELVELRADAVVLATGGYGAGGAVPGSLLHKIRPDLVNLPTTNGDHSQGDGVSVGMDAGANAIALKHVQVHPTGLVNPADPDNRTKLLCAEMLRGEGGIIVDRDGNRFCNDIGKRDYVTGMMWSHNKPPYRILLNKKASSQAAWHCEHYKSRRVMKHFKNAEGVAKEMGIPTEQLKASLDAYNAAAASGKECPLTGKIHYHNTPLEMDEDYYVGIITPVVHYTMGGLAISDKCECVYEETSRVIPGLYAAGEVTGGVHGRNRLGGSGLAEAVVLGRRAAHCALDYMATDRSTPVGGPSTSTTTTVSIPQPNGADPITITTVTSGGASAGEAVGEYVEINPWDDEVTTQLGQLTSGADGKDGKAAPAAAKKEAAPVAVDSGPATDVAVVYGSFFMGDSKRDADDILAAFPKDSGMSVSAAPIEGNNFNFNNLKDTKFLVVCTSSMYGNPPKNFWEFYFHLKAASENPNKPLSHMQHAVYGNGDETYLDTYMNVPRMVDMLLERAGSRRFFCRGETGEPFSPLKEEEGLEAQTWAPGMWDAMKTADIKAPGKAWNGLWEGTKPSYHEKVSDWDMKYLEKKFGAPDTPSIFSASKSRL